MWLRAEFFFFPFQYKLAVRSFSRLVYLPLHCCIEWKWINISLCIFLLFRLIKSEFHNNCVPCTYDDFSKSVSVISFYYFFLRVKRKVSLYKFPYPPINKINDLNHSIRSHSDQKIKKKVIRRKVRGGKEEKSWEFISRKWFVREMPWYERRRNQSVRAT